MPEQPRPPRLLRASDIGWVFVGGTVGGLLRVLLAVTFESSEHALPWVTLAENVTGAFLLGAFLGIMSHPARRRLRLLLGTGALGSFTTYSTFAVELHALVAPAEFALALAYAILTLAGGLFAALLGLRIGRARRTTTGHPTPRTES